MWSIDIMPADSWTPTVTGAPFAAFRATWTTEGPGAIEIEVNKGDMADVWTPGFHRIKVNGDKEWGGEITRLGRSGRPDQEEYRVSGLGHIHRLDQRIVRFDFVVNDTADVIVEALLTEVQDNQFNGDMGFTMGTTTGTFTTRRRAYCPGVGIADAIRELAAIGRGFDWEIDADGALNMWAPSRGGEPAFTLAEEDCSLFEPTLDTSEMLTNVTVLGDPSDPFGPQKKMSRTAFADDYGRRERSEDSDVITEDEDNPDWEDELYDIGHAILREEGGGYLSLHTMWLSDRGPWELGQVWLEDEIPVTLPSWFGGTVDMRCTDVTVNVERMPPSGANDPIYFVEHSFDAVVGTLTDGDPDEGS